MLKMKKIAAAASSALLAAVSVTSAIPAAAANTADLQLDNYAKLLQYSLYFYDANMCGSNAGEDSAFSWRDDCHTGDLIAGGFHDAGDTIECGLPTGFTASTLGWTFYEYREQFEKTGTDEHYKVIMNYFNDFIKASTTMNNGEVSSLVYQVGDAGADHSVWCAPETLYSRGSNETYTTSNGASDVAAQYAAALAQSYINFGNSEDLEYAVALYNFADKYRTVSYNNATYAREGVQDDISWAAGWLYLATGEDNYLSESNKYTQYTDNWTYDYFYGNAWLGAAIINAEITGNWSNAVSYISGVVNSNQNNYYVMDSWGSARHNTLMQLCALVTSKYEASGVDFTEWSKKQMNYILGENDADVCLVVGYNDVSATSPHHRAASCLKISSDWHEWNEWNGDYAVTGGHTLYGALCGGPTNSSFKTYNASAKDATSNEVALDYQCGLVGAAAGLYAAYNTGNVVSAIGDDVKVYASEIAVAGGQEVVVTKPVTKPTTTKATTITTTTTTTKATVKTTVTTTAKPTTTTKVTTKAHEGAVIVLNDVKLGETYDISAYSDISKVDFVFNCTPAYGMNGCAVFGNWEYQNNYEASALVNDTLTVELDRDYKTMTLHKWYGDANLKSVVIYTGNAEAKTTKATTTTTKPTTTATKTTTTTTKPTTTTTKTTTTTAKPTTTTTKTTTTTAKPTTTTTKTTTTTAKPTTTTTKTTTTTAKSTTTTTTVTTTTAPVTTTTPTDTENKVVLTDVAYDTSYSLEDYDYKSITKIIIKLDGNVGYGFGGNVVLGGWASQYSYGASELTSDNTIEFTIDNPQSFITVFNYWGSMNLESVTLCFTD